MNNRILISEKLFQNLIELSNCNNEHIGYLLTERTPSGLHTFEMVFAEGGDNRASEVSEQELPAFRSTVSNYLLAVRRNPALAVIGSHIHSRRFGDRIQRYDPYWTINGNSSNHPLDSIVNRVFYVSGRGGDDIAFETDVRKYRVDHHLFVHPSFGSEGQLMTPEKVKISGFKYDPSRLGKVRDVEVEIT